MSSSLKTRLRRDRPNVTTNRGHVRPADRAGTPTRPKDLSEAHARPKDPALRRMKPLSQLRADGAMVSTPRRTERRLRRARGAAPSATPKVRRRASPVYLLSWRAVSGMIVLGLTIVLYLFLTADAFFVNAIAIGAGDGSGNFVDLKYLTPEEIFRYSDIAGDHIFWVDPRDIEQRLEQVPNIAQATVKVGWPPNLVQIEVIEREPALTWEQSVRVWVDVNGIVMRQREDRPDLLRIVVPNSTEPLGPGARIPQDIVDGALYLRSRFPNIEVLLYDPVKGLGFHHGGGWTIWFGGGAEMDVKLRVYLRIEEEIKAQGIQPGEVFMNDPDRPYFTILWREES